MGGGDETPTNRLKSKIETLIERLADLYPIISNPDGADYCALCHAYFTPRQTSHATDCPYILAQEFHYGDTRTAILEDLARNPETPA